jgi:hypothetical protein
MASPTSLDRLKPEERAAPRSRYDFELAEILSQHLQEQLEKGHDDYIASFHNFLLLVVRSALPELREQHQDGRAVTYLAGRVNWQLGLNARRPPRGWSERGEICHLELPGIKVYPVLDQIGRRVIDFWLLLAVMTDKQKPEDAGRLLYAWRTFSQLQRSLTEIRARLLPKERLRLSALAG